MSELYVRNRQRTCPIDTRFVRNLVATLLAKICPTEFHIGVLVVGDLEMTRLNEGFLKHAGTTDVLAFDYSPGEGEVLEGEVIVCMDEARRQAQRYGTTWHKEITRYIIHGLLHLHGYDDSNPAARLRMKDAENRLVKELARQFDLSRMCSVQ
jgi:probable rRNA maturation factor